MSVSSNVPAGPIRRVLNEAIKKAEAEHGLVAAGRGSRNGASIVAEQIASYSQRPAGRPAQSRDAVRQSIHRIRTGQVKSVKFELADTILCALGHQFDWLTTSELARVYERAARVRTCDTVTNGRRTRASEITEPAVAG